LIPYGGASVNLATDLSAAGVYVGGATTPVSRTVGRVSSLWVI
jgi:hypothetical protein